VTGWPRRNGHRPSGGRSSSGSRWPTPRRPPATPPAWFDRFVVEDWAEPSDDEVRYGDGEWAAAMGAKEVARRRWTAACHEWAAEHDMSIADWLAARHRARRRAMGWDRG
jgi:hypothetical protein